MSRSSIPTAVVLLVLALVGWAAPANAETPRARRVVLLETPPGLERALRTALMPWGMRVGRSHGRARPRAPKDSGEARTLARRLRADALVWLAPSLKRHELWLYDGSNGSLTARSVPAPPFDETRSAALALSVKTELRKGTLADAPTLNEPAAKTVPPAGKAEFDASLAAPLAATPPEPPPEPPAPSEPAPTPESAEAPAASAPPLRPKPSESERPELDTSPFVRVDSEPNDAPRWKLVLHAVARQGATSLGGTDARYAVEGRWAPWADPASIVTLWFAARADLGLPWPIETRAFTGEYSELGGGVGVGVGVRLSPWLEAGMQVGAGLRAATVSGELGSDGTPGEATRRSLDFQVRPEMELSLGTLGVLLQPALGTSLGRQRFTADGEEVLETSAVWWQLGAGVRIALY